MDYAKKHYLIRIVDDDADFVRALKFSLELEGWKVQDFGSAEAFLARADFESPGCALIDYQLGGMNGMELYLQLKETQLRVPIVFLTAFANVSLTVQAFREGVCDFLQKPLDPDELTAAINKAIDMDDACRRRMQENSPAVLFEMLTDAQKEVAFFVARGMTCKAIGERLGKSCRTIERHRGNIMRILRIRTVDELKDILKSLSR